MNCCDSQGSKSQVLTGSLESPVPVHDRLASRRAQVNRLRLSWNARKQFFDRVVGSYAFGFGVEVHDDTVTQDRIGDAARIIEALKSSERLDVSQFQVRDPSRHPRTMHRDRGRE